MGGTTRRPRLGVQAGRFFGKGPAAERATGAIAGPPPAEVLADVSWNPKRQGSEKLHPLGFVRTQSATQDLRPASPYGVSLAQLDPSVQGLDLTRGTKRRLASLPPQLQREIHDAISRAQEPHTDELYRQLMETHAAAMLTPGKFEAQDLKEILDDQAALAARLRGLQEERAAAAEVVPAEAPIETSDYILPTMDAPEYAPSEDVDGAAIDPEESLAAEERLMEGRPPGAAPPSDEEIAAEALRLRKED